MAATHTVSPDDSYVFVSYGSADRDRVLEVISAFEDAGGNAWLDREQLAGGSIYGPRIVAAIRDCAAVLLCSSLTSLGSRNVRQELALAWKYERPILPLILEFAPVPDDVAYWLEGVQWVEVLDRQTTQWLPELLSALKLVGTPRESMPLPELTHAEADSRAEPFNLPLPATPIFGRETEIREVVDLLKLHRLVTLTGPGGAGKSRLALAVAEAAAPLFSDGVVFISLATVTDTSQVPSAIARALNFRETGERPIVRQVIDALRDRSLLLVLDSFEQVIESASQLAEFLSAAPRIKVLVTSREPLRLSTEHLVVVAPLRLPEGSLRTDQLANLACVQLFVDRARSAQPSFSLTDDNAKSIEEICRRLDGLPLAIELAAARVAHLSPAALLARMQRSLPILTGGARDLPARQRTLRDTIAWSHDLLTPGEQTLFRRLSVFVDGWTIEAAERVAGPREVFDHLGSLVDKSLVGYDDSRIPPRYSMLLTVREFAMERQHESGEEQASSAAHAAWVLDLAEAAETGFLGPSELTWLQRCDEELGNIRAALERGAGQGLDTQTGLRIASALWWYWHSRVGMSEGRRWLERGLAREDPDVLTAVRAKAIGVMGFIASFQGDHAVAEQSLVESERLFHEAEDPDGEALASFLHGVAIQFRGDAVTANQRLRLGLAKFEAEGNNVWKGLALFNLGLGAGFRLGDRQQGLQLLESAVAEFREAGYESGVAMALGNLGALMLASGGDLERAQQILREALNLRIAHGDLYGLAEQLLHLAQLAARQGDGVRGAILLAASDALRERIGTAVPMVYQFDRSELGERLLDLAGEEECESAIASGKQDPLGVAALESRGLLSVVLSN